MRHAISIAASVGLLALPAVASAATTPTYGQLEKENARLRTMLAASFDKQIKTASPLDLWVLVTKIYPRFPDNGFACPIMWSKSTFASGKTRTFDFTRSVC